MVRVRAHDAFVRTLNELISADEDAWPTILGWLAGAPSLVEILACERQAGEATLLALQVTTRSPMGALALRSGGILLDCGWIRLLGARGDRIGDGLVEWNAGLGGAPLDPPLVGATVVAYDAVGGFFAINADRWDAPVGSVHYLGPDGTGWQPLGLTYSGLMQWSMSESVATFYDGLRWTGWEDEVAALAPDAALLIYPPPGFEATAIADRARRPVPARELWTLAHEPARQVADSPEGARFRFLVG